MSATARGVVAWLVLGSSWTGWGVALLTWGLGQGGAGTLAAMAGGLWLDHWAGPAGGYWVWTAAAAWLLLAADREEGRPALGLRLGVVLLVSLLIGRLALGRLGWPGGALALLQGGLAAWMVEK